MENVPSWHGSVQIKPEELKEALKELGVSSENIELYLKNDHQIID